MKETGTVTWFNTERGYGFIKRDDGGPDAFVHYSKIEVVEEGLYKVLAKGDKVEFETYISERDEGEKLQAKDVRLVGERQESQPSM